MFWIKNKKNRYTPAYPSLADCKILLVKTSFCRAFLHVIIVILEIFVGHLTDRIKYFVSQNEILLVLTDRRALVKTEIR